MSAVAPLRLGWLSTGRDPAARNLLTEVVRRAARDGLPLGIEAVFCDRVRGESPESDLFIDLIESLGFPLVSLSSRASWQDADRCGVDREAWRAVFHGDVMRSLEPRRLDLLVLAGYMLVVSPRMCDRYAMLNLHPALPGGPKGTWQDVIWDLLRHEATETGAMIHVVTRELDRGPVVAFDRFPIVGPGFAPLWEAFTEKVADDGFDLVRLREGEDEPLFATVRAEGEQREIPLLYQTLAQFLRGRLKVVRGDEGSPAEVVGNEALPLDLSAEVSREVGARPVAGEPGAGATTAGGPGAGGLPAAETTAVWPLESQNGTVSP